MKKRVFAAILALVTVFVLTACGDSNVPAQQTVSPSNESNSATVNSSEGSTNSAQSLTPSEAPTESTSAANTTLPDDLSSYSDGNSWEIGSFGYEPTVIKTYTTGNSSITLSVPEIPNSLRQFAESRGDSYILSYAENLQDGSNIGTVYFYQKNCSLILGNTGLAAFGGLFLQPEKTDDSAFDQYFPYSFAFGTMENTANDQGFVASCEYSEEIPMDGGKTGRRMEQWLDTVESMGKDYTFGEYTNTSVYPTEEHIQLLLQAIETYGAN